jgi:hypothetical protein
LVVVVACLLFLFTAPIFAGRKTLGEVQEKESRLRTGLWNKDDADRLR